MPPHIGPRDIVGSAAWDRFVPIGPMEEKNQLESEWVEKLTVQRKQTEVEDQGPVERYRGWKGRQDRGEARIYTEKGIHLLCLSMGGFMGGNMT